MKIEFKSIIPNPLLNSEQVTNSVWGNTYEWHAPQKTILNAVSGKGKSTFIGILSGVRTDFEGDLIINAKSTKGFSNKDWTELRATSISTVYQDLQLFLELTILENLQVKNNLTNHFTEQKLLVLIDEVGLTAHLSKKCKILSLGQQQRVAILRALCQPFKILLMDEPFSHLDKVNELIIVDILKKELEENQAGLIMTTLGETPTINFDTEIVI
jgi:ABC-type lipoprotein export system ATPase subunit